MFASKSKRDTNSNEKQSEKQFDSISFEQQQQIILLKGGVHNLQNDALSSSLINSNVNL
jgi:hypothetical protein